MRFISYLLIALSGISLHATCHHHKPKPRPTNKPVQHETAIKPEVQQAIFQIIEPPKQEPIKPQEPILQEIKIESQIQKPVQTEAENKIVVQVQDSEKEFSSNTPKKIIAGSSALLFMTSIIVHYCASSQLHNKLSIIRNS